MTLPVDEDPQRWLLRPATSADAALLLEWRNDPAARAASHQQAAVTPSVHARWLTAALASAERRILIAELQGRPVAMARLDCEAGARQLSWFVSASCRGAGVGRRLLTEVLAQGWVDSPVPIRAEIKPDNLASIRLAEAIGFKPLGLRDGVLHFRIDRPALSDPSSS